MPRKSRASRKRAPAIRIDKPVFAYTPEQLNAATADMELHAADQGETRVNERAGNMRVRHVMDRRLYFNAIAAGEDPKNDEGYKSDMVKRGLIRAVPVVTGTIVGRPLSFRGRQNYDEIFRPQQPA